MHPTFLRVTSSPPEVRLPQAMCLTKNSERKREDGFYSSLLCQGTELRKQTINDFNLVTYH
ncbi:hypothetical protein NECAME_12363 [Necator americanus]|uniref:Uncharacterized protein n=1 Tax=Necator americanus TaxID=51031 RepID=W2T0D7_NECAM|nr:hypothetical protein NECAME_12363 [Necator americanus]ETN75470.1 hypothetical protein NECAME_12363 [Necator americanus]